MKKRILSLFMAFVMAVGLLPMSAFAAEYEATEMTIPNTYCTINPAMDYEENGAVEFYKWGSLYPSITKYVVQVPAGTERVVITLGNSICLTPDYYEPTQNNFYYGTMTWSENADGYGTAGYTGRESEVSYTVIDAETSSIELDVASLIAGEKMFYTIDGSWNPLYAIEFEYAASSGGHECSWNAGVVTKAATCQETGIKTYTCTVSGCSETKTEEIPLADHDWNSGEVTKEATCKEVGKLIKTCTVSGCGETKEEEIPLADHAWNSGEVTKQATCKEAGEKTYTCTVSGCDETKTESIAKLTTHTYGEDGKAEYCSVCETALNPDYVDPNMPELVEGVYQIGTADQLLSFAKFVNKGNTNLKAVLTADIDLTDKTWTPMTSSNAAFSFDGQGHTIFFDDASNGLFAVLRGKWNSKNNYNIDTYATVENVIVAGTIRGAGNVAAIAGEAYGVKITKCLNQADITGSGNVVGGMIGLAHKSIAGYQYSNIMIDQCANTGSIQGASNVGGLVGAVYNTRSEYTSYITNSYNWGSVGGSKNGALIGNANYNNSSSYSAYLGVTNCYNAGSPSALVGSGESNRFTISNTYYLSDSGDTSDRAKTAEEMKSADFVTALGEYYRKSSTYPILSWQATSGVEYAVAKPTTAGITFVGMEMAYSDENYTFTVEINERYRITDEFAILVNGGETDVNCELKDGVYSCTIAKEDITSDLVITVIGVEATKTVLYTGSGKPTSWVYVSEIAVDDVQVKSINSEDNTIYVVLKEGTALDADVYFTVAKGSTQGSSALHMLNISPGVGFTRQLNGGSLTEIITAEVVNDGTVSWTIVVTVDGITTYHVTLPTGTGYTVKGATAAVGGQDYTFTVELGNAYMQGETFAVKANGTPLTANADGSYTVKNVGADLNITVEGVVEKPFEDPFVSIKAGDQTLSAEDIKLVTKDFHLGGAGVENFEGRVYENVPYYQVVVDKGVEWVEVIFKAATDILTDNVARGYETDISGVDAVTSATIRGTSFKFTQNEDGTKSLKIPVSGYTVNSEGGKATGPEMEGQSNQPVALFSFLHEYSILVSETDAFTVVPQEGYSATVLGGDDFKFTVLTNPGYSKGEDFAVKVNNEAVTPDENGVYTIANITEDKTIAVDGEAQAEAVRAYLSVSHDAAFVQGAGGVAVLQEVEVPWFDLSLYGLEEYAIAEDAAGYQEPTLLHLYIVATEIIYCGLDADEAGRGYLYKENLMSTLLNATQAPGSLYMADFWGYDENLRYFYNYEYPYYPGTTTGATSDRIILEDGDVATVGHFTDWKAHEDSANGFNYLVAGENDEVTTSVKQGEELVLTVRRTGGGMGGSSYDAVVEASVDLWYTAVESVDSGDVTKWSKLGTTTNGVLTVEATFAPGEYVIAVAGQKGAATQSICSAPGAILLTVEEKVETDAERDAAAAKVVYDLIEALPGKITLDAEEQIIAARNAYSNLTSVQKTMVFNEVKLIAAENALAALKDAAAAKAVDDQIEAIDNVTLEDEDAIRAARIAYNLLSGTQKALVTKLDTLTAAELELDRLKSEANSFAEMYQATKAYLASLSAPTVGSTNGEWRVIGLARSDGAVADSYYNAVVSYVAENIQDGRLHASKSTENSRIILALTALGKDVTNVGGHDLLQGLSDQDYVKKQGLNGTIWALIAFDSGNYTIPAGDISREALIAEILSKQTSDGGWALSGDTYDSDMTGMALQALAPYYKTSNQTRSANDQVKTAVGKALTLLSQEQQSNGGFLTDGNPTSESVAQVVTALTALGIDPDTDSRFIKNGVSALDALAAYYLGEGKFEHGAGGGYNVMATEQAFYALVAYDRFQKGETALYDMSDVTIQEEEPPVEEPIPVTGITLNKTTETVSVGETITLTATVSPADATDKTVTWSTSNSRVAVVNRQGKVTGVAEGVAYITAKAGEVTASCLVTVTPAQETEPDFGLTESQIKGYVTVSFEDFGKRVSGESMGTIYKQPLGTIIPATQVPYTTGDTIASVTLRLLDAMDFTASYEGSQTSGFYLEAIGNFIHKNTYYASFGEFDAGVGSGWMITWNNWFIDQGASEFTVKNGDVIRWQYTCQLGKDIGQDMSGEVETVKNLIDAIGTVTKDSGPAITAARTAYDKLTSNQKALVTNYSKLTAAEKAYADLLAQEEVPGVSDLPYTDVSGHWAEEAIAAVYELGLMIGTKDDQFAPEEELSRAMLVTILYRMEGEPAVTGSNTFSDVKGDTWYTDAVIWASQNGIVNGVGKDRFAPNQDITREQMATMLLRYSDYKDYDTTQRNDLTGYTDADSISDWALEALQWANGEGLITGRKADLLAPKGDTTRGETATILMRYLETIA